MRADLQIKTENGFWRDITVKTVNLAIGPTFIWGRKDLSTEKDITTLLLKATLILF